MTIGLGRNTSNEGQLECRQWLAGSGNAGRDRFMDALNLKMVQTENDAVS